jgi:hypothetical protein
MSEKDIPSSAEVVEAAGNVIRMLSETDNSPVNVEYIRKNFELALEDESIRLTIIAMLELLINNQADLLVNREIYTDAFIFITYLEAIDGQVPAEILKEVEIISIKLVPVIEALNNSGNRRISEQILLAIKDLSTEPSYDPAHRMYINLQMAIEMEVVVEEQAKKNLREVYDLFASMVREALEKHDE